MTVKFYEEFVNQCDGTLVLLDWDQRVPRPEQLNVVLAEQTRQWNKFKRIPWNIYEHPGNAFDARTLADTTRRMLSEPRYLRCGTRGSRADESNPKREFHANSSCTGLPPPASCTGRPNGVCNVISGSMPSAVSSVAAISDGVIGRSMTLAACLSVAPMVIPRFKPPPAMTIENACGQ